MPASPDPADFLLAHADFVPRLAKALMGEDGADVAQQAFLRALRSPPREPTRGYWATTVRRLVANALRGRRRRLQHEARRIRDNTSAAASFGPTPQEVLLREETRRHLIAAVLSLDEPFRQVVLLRFYEAMSPAEISTRLGIAGATVRSRLARGLQRLRHKLAGAEGSGDLAWTTTLLAPSRTTDSIPILQVLVMKKVVCLTAAALLVFACLLWWTPWAESPPLREPAAATTAAATTTSSGAPPAPAPLPLREAVEEDLQVVVLDEDGTGVPDARVILGRALAPWLPDAESRHLGATSAEGILHVPAAEVKDLAPRRLDLYAHHDDHLGASVEGEVVAAASSARHALRIVLRRGHSQTFYCRTRTGAPVVGQCVLLSTTDGGEDFTKAPPGRPGTTFEAVHRAVSDGRGEASFRGLPAGTYRFWVAADPRFGVVEGRRAAEGLTVPGPPVDLLFDEWLAGGLVVDGDEVVTASAHYYARQLGSTFATPHDTMLQVLLEQCPQLEVETAPLAWMGFSNPRLQRPPAVRWRVLLARTGWHEGETPLRPLRGGFAPEVLTIAPDRPSAPMGTVLVTWPAKLPPLGFRLSQRTNEGLECRIAPGQPLRVPPGRYALTPDLPGPPDLFGTPRLEVIADRTTEFAAALPERVAAGEVTVTLPSGRIARGGTLQWRQFERTGFWQLRSDKPAIVLLPTGTVDLTVTARGCETQRLRIEVAPNDRATAVNIAMSGAR